MAEETKSAPAGDRVAPSETPTRSPDPGYPPTGGLPDPTAREIATVLRTLLDLIGIRSRVDVERAGDEYYANIRPQVSKGLLIGHRGTTLKAIQYLTRLIVKRTFPDVPPVMVDVGGYRSRREDFLRKKAEAVARIVLETGREMALDPLTEKERLMVEEHLRRVPEVRVYAIAAGSKQNVIIAPK
jgi:spoIIIJ-associated protein